jgi:hypothetical protein
MKIENMDFLILKYVKQWTTSKIWNYQMHSTN